MLDRHEHHDSYVYTQFMLSRERAIRAVVAAQWALAIRLDLAVGLRDPLHDGQPDHNHPLARQVAMSVRNFLAGLPTPEQIVDGRVVDMHGFEVGP